MQVCKKSFMDVHGITKSKFKTLVKAKNLLIWFIKKKRQQENRKFSKNNENLIIEHVNAFPRVKSHYSRSKSDKDYLSQDLNINRLFRAFQEKHPNSNITY